MKLNHTRTLEYYDVPRLFVAEDILGVQYLCKLYDIAADGELRYISVRVSKSKLNDFIKGHIELLQMFTSPEVTGDYYSVTIAEDGIEADNYKGKIIEAMLPKKGYYFDDSFSEDQEMVDHATKNNRLVIRLAFETPDNRHDIDLYCFSAATAHFQSLIEQNYKDLYKNDDPRNCKLRLTTFSAASFDVELMAEEQLDLFGQSKTGKVIEYVNNLFSSDKELVANTFKQMKGTAKNSYRRFVNVLRNNGMTINLKWVESTIENIVHQNKVEKKLIQVFYDIVNTNPELMAIGHSLEGFFTAVNKNSGTWTFTPHEGKKISGECEDKDMLVGIVIGNKRYMINYQTEQPSIETTFQPAPKCKLLEIIEL